MEFLRNPGFVGTIGLLAVIVLMLSILIFGFRNDSFSFLNDFISKLGAEGEPNALWFNLMCFVMVGIILFVFGVAYGLLLKDKLLSTFLSFFGVGFAFSAIPFDAELPKASLSTAHVVAICLGLVFWMFGLSRIGYNQQIERSIRNRANFSAIALVISMAGFGLGLWSMPITHRLVFGVVFGWTAVTSILLLSQGDKKGIKQE